MTSPVAHSPKTAPDPGGVTPSSLDVRGIDLADAARELGEVPSPPKSPPPRLPLTPLEIAALLAIILIWGINNVAAKLATNAWPPMFVGAIRFSLALMVLVPFLKPPIPRLKDMAGLALCCGPLHFGVLYLSYSMAHNVSALSVALQIWIPFSTLFAWLLLGEALSAPILLGMGAAFLGVVVMIGDPAALQDWPAILVSVGASAFWALGTILARKIQGVRPQKMQAMIAILAAPSFLLVSSLVEGNPLVLIRQGTVLSWAAVIWAGLISTVFATGLMFWLVQRRQAGEVTPYFLATPLVSVLLGVGFLGDAFTLRMMLGALLVLGGVGFVALAGRIQKRAKTEI